MLRPALLASLSAALLAAAFAIPAHSATPGAPDYTVPAARDTDPVVLTGKDLLVGGSQWSVPENLTAAVPSKDVTCYAQHPGSDSCPDQYNHYVDPDVDSSTVTGDNVQGTPTEKILGYRWKTDNGVGNGGGHWQQIPFQVDEVFTRYLNNDASGFGVYSGTDKHTTYAYDREGFRFTENSGTDGCYAAMKDGDHAAKDPVKGLDTNDELAFMASDAGPQAPSGTELPRGIEGAKVVTITDPTNPTAAPSYVYVMRAAADGPAPAFNADNGYVHYQRDANADILAYSKSSYGGYGPAKQGPYCTPDGKPVLNADGSRAIGPRRELDGTTITTPRYKYRYDGRWLMTGIQISDDGGQTYGPDIVDRWKARAFAQDPGSNTPCCGYEEEDTNWGGSSSLLGERTGPVRAIRETWGADSGTNVIRRETFYRDRMVQKNWLRVHVIPPLDGIYAQWDFNAGRVNKFFNSAHPDGVAVDGQNDEVYGNFDDPCEDRWDNDPSRTQLDSAYRQLYVQAQGCVLAKAAADNDPTCLYDCQLDYYHQSIDPGDATFGDANAALGWSEVAGPYGTIVDRIHSEPTDLTPGGAAQSIAAVPYYRDDSCFDDGTGADPGPELFPRHFDQEKATGANGARRCWTPADGPTNPDGGDRGDPQFWQGDIGTHGLHLLFQAESDNARTTVPVSEIVSDWDMVMLPPTPENQGNVGEKYGRPLEKPLVTVVSDPAPGSLTANTKGKKPKK